MAPTEPPPSAWEMPDPGTLPEGQEIVGVGADLEPGTLLAGYRTGIFAMPLDLRRRNARLGWWSPDPRGVLSPGAVHVGRSMRRALRRYSVSIDRDFEAVLAACADPGRPGGWITVRYALAYRRLHELGWAHSVEVWDEGGRLAGGLFGVELGGLFAGESMFHHPRLGTNASKVALVALCAVLAAAEHSADRLVDVQWCTPHLATMGVRRLSRADYLALLPRLLAAPPALSDQVWADVPAPSRITWRSPAG